MKIAPSSSLLSFVEVGAGARLSRVVVDDNGGFASFGLVDGGRVVYGEDRGKGLAFFDIDSGERVASVDVGGGTMGEALLSPDGSRIAVQGWDDRPFVRLLDRAGALLGEDRELKDQHARIGFTGSSGHLVIAHSWFGGPWPLHLMDRDGRGLPIRRIDVEPRGLVPAGPTAVAVHSGGNGVQVVDVDGGNSDVFGHAHLHAVNTLAVDGDRLAAGAQTGEVMLFSLPGGRASWPSSSSLLDARLAPQKALLARLAARREKARSNDHKRFLDDQLKHTRATLKKATPLGDHPTIFAGVGGTLNAVALVGDDVIAGSDTDLVRFSVGALREDVLLCATPAAGLHVRMKLLCAEGGRLLVDLWHTRGRERWVLQLLPQPAAERAATTTTTTKTKAAKKKTATKTAKKTATTKKKKAAKKQAVRR